MSAIIGVDAKAYRETGSDFANPVWALLTNLRDVGLSIEVLSWDATVRGVAFVQHLPTLFDLEASVSALWIKGDAGLAAITAALWGRNYIDIAFVDEDITEAGADGIRAPWGVFTGGRNEAMTEGLTVDFSFRPLSTGDPDVKPERWITPAGP